MANLNNYPLIAAALREVASDNGGALRDPATLAVPASWGEEFAAGEGELGALTASERAELATGASDGEVGAALARRAPLALAILNSVAEGEFGDWFNWG